MDNVSVTGQTGTSKLTFTDVPDDKTVEQFAEELDVKKDEEEQAKAKEEQAAIDEMVKNSNGGTEQMLKGLHERVDKKLMDNFQIITSRVRWVDPDKKTILWLHDLPWDPEAAHIKDEQSRDRFDKFICVSNWQMQMYNTVLGLPYKDSLVLPNAIDPIEFDPDSLKGDSDENIETRIVRLKDELIENDEINLIYHTTPHRGLELLVPVFIELAKTYKQIHLHVYSSFEVYGWGQRDEPYKKLFDICEEHDQITYYGYQPRDVVIEQLKKTHIFAYPSIWQETSCLSAIEAMSAGCNIVAPNYGALPETMANFGYTYQYSEDPQEHCHRFGAALTAVLDNLISTENRQWVIGAGMASKRFVDRHYDWSERARQWTILLESLMR